MQNRVTLHRQKAPSTTLSVFDSYAEKGIKKRMKRTIGNYQHFANFPKENGNCGIITMNLLSGKVV